MRSLGKNKIILFPFFLGLGLLFISWYLSYPLTIDSVDDVVFNHISILYWVGVSLLLTSFYVMAVTFKNRSLKWIIVVGMVLTIYSLSYFYALLPGSDQQFYRGLAEYFTETKNLDPLQPNHSYYQWPFFYVLSYIVSSVCGLSIRVFEFLIYTIIGFLLTISLWSYASRAYKKGGFLSVPVFFISIFLFLNYQCGPFALALSLLFLLFMLDTKQRNIGFILTTIILFTSIVLSHLFVPLFFVIYLLLRAVLEKNKQYANLFLLALSVYFVYQLTIAQSSFETYIRFFLTASSEYSGIVQTTIATAQIPIDAIAQMFSRWVTIGFIALSGVGFLLLLIKRKLGTLDKAILLTGLFYSGIGLFFAALGARAIPLAFIPISLGVAWLFESKFKPYFKPIFSILIIILLSLFTFIPLHQSFNSLVLFQTQEAYIAENFLINNTNWDQVNQVLAYHSVIPYLSAKLGSNEYFTSYLQDSGEPDIIFYTVGLGKSLLSENYTMEQDINR